MLLIPDRFRWDLNILKRHREERIFSRHMTVWVVSLEDMIVMKIANGKSQDLKDLEGIVARRFREVDWKYLRTRARQFNLRREVDEIHKRFSM